MASSYNPNINYNKSNYNPNIAEYTGRTLNNKVAEINALNAEKQAVSLQSAEGSKPKQNNLWDNIKSIFSKTETPEFKPSIPPISPTAPIFKQPQSTQYGNMAMKLASSFDNVAKNQIANSTPTNIINNPSQYFGPQ